MVSKITRRKQSLNTFPVPRCYVNGNAAYMIFWSAIYYLLATEGWTDPSGSRYLETTTQKITELTGLSERKIRDQFNTIFEQPSPYRLFEEESSMPYGRLYVLPNYKTVLRRNAYCFPIGYVKNSWLGFVYMKSRSRLPVAIINCLLSKPENIRVADVEELRHRCRDPGRQSLPSPNNFLKALHFLEQLKLIRQIETRKYQLLERRFEARAALPIEPVAVRTARKQNPQMTELAIELAELGLFDLETHFAEVMRDLEFVGENDLDLLRKIIKKWYKEPASINRWKECWRSFCNERRKRRILSNPITVRFDQEIEHTILPPFPDLTQCSDWRYAKLVIWLSDEYNHMDYLGVGIRVILWQEGRKLQNCTLKEDGTIKRIIVTENLRNGTQTSLTLQVIAEKKVPNVSVKMRIEVGCGR